MGGVKTKLGGGRELRAEQEEVLDKSLLLLLCTSVEAGSS